MDRKQKEKCVGKKPKVFVVRDRHARELCSRINRKPWKTTEVIGSVTPGTSYKERCGYCLGRKK